MRSTPAAPALLGLALLLLLPGCLTLRETFVLAEDGSGTVTLQHDFDPAALAALLARVRGVLEEPGGEGGVKADPKANPVAPTWLTTASKGVKDYRLVKVEAAPLEGGRTRTTADGTFTSLEAAAQGEAFHGADVRLERLPKGAWRFTLRDPWTPAGPGSSDVFGGIEAALVRSTFGPDLEALSRTLVMTFPVPVRSANGTLSENRRTVTWTSKADASAPEALTAEFVLAPECAWTPFRRRPDLGALARRCLVAPPEPPAPRKEEPPPPK